MQSPRNNVRAGMVTVAVVAAATLLLWGWMSLDARRMAEYRVRFTAAQGVYGLESGSPVTVGGLARGQVVEVHPDLDGDALRGYVVRIRIDRDVPVTTRTRVEARAEDVSGAAVLAMENVGRPAPMTQAKAGPSMAGLLPEGSEIVASTPDGFRTWGGTASGPSLRKLYDAWFVAATDGKTLPGRLRASYGDLSKSFPEARKEFGRLREDVERDLDAWRAGFAEVRDEASSAMARIGIGAEGDGAEGSLKRNLGELGREVRDIPAVESARWARTSDSFDQAVAAVKKVGARAGELRAMLAEAGTLGDAGADFSVAAQELSAGKAEALRAPWRLLARPDEAQRAKDARIELARAYAEAAAEHQRAMKGIEDALRRDAPLLEKDPALAALLRSRLEAANALFEARLPAMEALLLGPERAASPATDRAP